MRLSKIVTKTGDDGTSGISNNERLPKYSLVFSTMGDIDELNSFIGLLNSKMFLNKLTTVQNKLFDIGAGLSTSTDKLSADDVLFLEKRIEVLNSKLPPLKEFILPKGSAKVCLAHVCRTITRRCERSYVNYLYDLTFPKKLTTDNTSRFLNRLSDFFFVLARSLSTEDRLWVPTHEYDDSINNK